MEASRTNTAQIQALLVLAGNGDEEALDQVIALAAERLEHLARRMLRKYPHLHRWEQTDDVFQTAAIRLQRSLQKVKPDCLRVLLGLATLEIRRTLIDLLRHHFGPKGAAANYQSDFQAGSYDGHQGALQNEPDHGDAAESLETWSRFHEAVESLSEVEREVMHLGWYAGMRQAEMAAVLGVSVSTIKRRWYRARIHLRAAMAGQMPPVAESERYEAFFCCDKRIEAVFSVEESRAGHSPGEGTAARGYTGTMYMGQRNWQAMPGCTGLPVPRNQRNLASPDPHVIRATVPP